MKENVLDRVHEGLGERIGRFRERIHSDFKGTQKFRQEPISEDEQLRQYDSLGIPGVMALVAQYGAEAIQSYIFNMEQMKTRRANDGRRK